MYTYLSTRCVSVLVPLLLALFLFATPAVPAHAVTSQDIHDQKLVVMEQLINTLEAHVKWLQLVVINRLEAQVAVLEAQVAAR